MNNYAKHKTSEMKTYPKNLKFPFKSRYESDKMKR